MSAMAHDIPSSHKNTLLKRPIANSLLEVIYEEMSALLVLHLSGLI